MNEYSGERYLPEMNDIELKIEHQQRYYSVQSFIEGLDVLDAACGEGYGSRILAESAKSVIGVDIDSETIAAAVLKYSDCHNLKYNVASVSNLSFINDASIDVVVSFETIEHITKELQYAFLKEIKRVLKPNGFLIMSTPDKKEYSDRYNFHNNFHVEEFYKDEFLQFIKTEFSNLELYNQYLEVASFIDKPDIDQEVIKYQKNIKEYNPTGKYIIVVASNVSIPKKSLSMVYMHQRPEYLSILDELNYCRNEAITCREKVVALDQYKNDIKLQKEELNRRAVELDNRMSLINELQIQIDILKNEKNQQKEELGLRAIELDNRMSLINELQNQIDILKNEKKQQKEELDLRAIELDNRMSLINELQDQLDSLKNENNQQKEELDLRAIELNNRMSLINELQNQIDNLKNEKNQQKEELNIRAIELDNRMLLINDLREENNSRVDENIILQNQLKIINKYSFLDLIKWFFKKSK